MKTVQIRSLPDKTHAILRQRAAAAGMSLQEYLLFSLNTLADRPTVGEVLSKTRGRGGGRIGFTIAVADLRTDRASR